MREGRHVFRNGSPYASGVHGTTSDPDPKGIPNWLIDEIWATRFDVGIKGTLGGTTEWDTPYLAAFSGDCQGVPTHISRLQ